METLQWLLFKIDPVLQILYLPCDWLLGWAGRFGGIGGVVAVGFLTGLGVNIFQKFFSRQKLLGQCKSDMDRLKVMIATAKKAGDQETAKRLTGVSGRISGKYMLRSLLPALWTIPPVIVVVMWAGSRLGYAPIRPGQEVEVVANFEDFAGGAARIVPQEGIEFAGPSLATVKMGQDTRADKKLRAVAEIRKGYPLDWNPLHWFRKDTAEEAKKKEDELVTRIKQAYATAPDLGVEARWKIRPVRAGDFKLTVCHGDQSFAVKLPVRAAGGRPPEIGTIFLWTSPGKDQLQTVGFTLKDSMDAAWWNLWIRWMGVYIIVAIVFGVSLRFALKVK